MSNLVSSMAARARTLCPGVVAGALALALPAIALADEPATTPLAPPTSLAAPGAPAALWLGRYAAFSLGAAGRGDDRVLLAERQLTLGTLELSGAEATLGIGTNFREWNGYVLGVEGALVLGAVDDTITHAPSTVSASSKVSQAFSLRGRIGRPVQEGRGLVYGSIGPSLGVIDYTVTGPGVNIDETITRLGYTLGLGYEHRLSPRLALRGEWAYQNYGAEIVRDGAESTKATPDYHALRLGLTFAF